MNQRASPVTAARAPIIFPCRNESATIRGCLEEVRQKRPALEIVVVDNGSTDDSAGIAANAGARVVVESRPGYGAALKCGLAAADGEWMLYADADGTYCLEHCAELLEAAMEADADLVIASRYGRVAPGTLAAAGRGIQPGAMPWTHRCLGTPLLTSRARSYLGTCGEDGGWIACRISADDGQRKLRRVCAHEGDGRSSRSPPWDYDPADGVPGGRAGALRTRKKPLSDCENIN